MIALIALLVQAQNPVPLYDNLGSHTHPISSTVPRVQQYFDQGLRLSYGFNHGEAIRAFREAARLDSTCAICWWGVAYAYGPNVNMPMDSAGEAAAWEALQRAVRLRSRASAAEQAWIDALSRRYGATPLAERAARDSAFARAMNELARRYPSDHDAATIAAEAEMNLRPWNYWLPDGQPASPGVQRARTALEQVLAANPDHPGACHFYIHVVEAGPQPELALPCARRLASLMPGAGHIVHMPAHIYIRLGMYEEAEIANVHAAHTDERYIADARPDGVYAVAYYPHNLHFLWAAAAFQGRRADAESALSRLAAAAPFELIRQAPPFELFALPQYYHRVWFGQWDAILRMPAPPAALRTSSGMWRYARGAALSAIGRLQDARAELDSLRALRASAPSVLPAGMTLGFAPPTALMDIAIAMLTAEIAARENRWDDAISGFREAVRLSDALTYNEPADWYYPPRLALGRALVSAGRAEEAIGVYRDDLARHPNSGWTLTGLARALEAAGRGREAAQVRSDLARAWARADSSLRSQ